VGRGGQLILPTDSIASVWHRKVSTGRTIGFVAGLTVLTAAVAAAISIGNSPPFSLHTPLFSIH
jgi:hypothetical protein